MCSKHERRFSHHNLDNLTALKGFPNVGQCYLAIYGLDFIVNGDRKYIVVKGSYKYDLVVD